MDREHPASAASARAPGGNPGGSSSTRKEVVVRASIILAAVVAILALSCFLLTANRRDIPTWIYDSLIVVLTAAMASYPFVAMYLLPRRPR